MSKIGKEIKNNKYTIIVFCIFLGLFLVAWLFYGMVMPSNGKPNYGTRLDDIPCEKRNKGDNLQIDCEYNSDLKNQSSLMVSNLKDDDNVVNASIDVKGKVVNAIVTVKADTKIKDAKKLTEKVTSVLNEEQLKHYDIQIFIKNEKGKTDDYPMIGYRKAGTEKFSY